MDRQTIVFHENNRGRAGAKHKDVDSEEATGNKRQIQFSLLELRAIEKDLLEQLRSVQSDIAAQNSDDASDDDR